MADGTPTPHRWDELVADSPMELLEQRRVVAVLPRRGAGAWPRVERSATRG